LLLKPHLTEVPPLTLIAFEARSTSEHRMMMAALSAAFRKTPLGILAFIFFGSVLSLCLSNFYIAPVVRILNI
jgi:hypothetical protein